MDLLQERPQAQILEKQKIEVLGIK